MRPSHMRILVASVFAALVAACATQPVVDAVPSTSQGGPASSVPLSPTSTVQVSGPGDPIGELAVARRRWMEAGSDSYSYRYLDDCGECDQLAERSLVVWDGEVSDPLGMAVSVDQAFDLIEEALASDRNVEVSYDPELGYPLDLWIDREARAYDGGTHLVFSSVELGLPGEDTALESHRQARDRWQAARPDAYEYASAVVCDCDFQVQMRTRVVDGLVSEFETRTPEPTDVSFSPLTIDQMFGDVEAMLTVETVDGGYRVTGSALYDDRYGHPVWIGLDLEPVEPESGTDPPLPDRLVLMITAFEPLELSPSGDLTDARARWEAAGLDSYSFDVVFHDVEAADFTETFTVEVVEARVVSVLQNGYDFGAEGVEGIGTIPDLFDQIESAQSAGGSAEVTYDTELGYPSVIVFGLGSGGTAVSVTLRR